MCDKRKKIHAIQITTSSLLGLIRGFQDRYELQVRRLCSYRSATWSSVSGRDIPKLFRAIRAFDYPAFRHYGTFSCEPSLWASRGD